MDPMTSAWLFSLISLPLYYLAGREKFQKSWIFSLVALLVVAANFAQLAYFANLPPLYLISGLQIVGFLYLVTAAALLAFHRGRTARNVEDHS